jgi:hypothetical protein
MSKLVIGIEKAFDGPFSGPGALLNVIPVADANGRALEPHAQRERRRENVIVPVGDRGEMRELDDLPDGEYVARVRLPTGETIDRAFSTKKGAPPVEIKLQAAPSKHEWLSWQQLSGNTTPVSSSVQLRATTRGAGATTGARPKAAYVHTDRADLRQAFTAFDVGITAQGPCGNGQLWEGLLRAGQSPPEAWQRFGNPAPACWSGELNAIDREDEEFRLVRTSRSDARWEGRTQESWRHFFVLRSKDALEIASVPLAWRTSSGVARHNVEILVKKRATADAFLTSVAIADEQASAMLSYMAQGRPDLARPFVEYARGLLFEKIDNPLGAAAGGYVLLANASAAGDSNWQNWTGNLKSMAQWLPDGAILHGIRKLRMGTTEQDFRIAGDNLLEAYRRGPPVFSLGIPLLQEGLMQMAHQWKEPAMQQALKTVNAFAAHLDTAQPFTTLRFDREA